MPFQLILYVTVGVASAAIDVGLLAELLRLGMQYAIATAIAYSVALVFNYSAQRKFTFRASHSTGAMFRYGVVVCVNLLLTVALVSASTIYFGSVMIGKIIALIIVAGVGFLASRFWIFA